MKSDAPEFLKTPRHIPYEQTIFFPETSTEDDLLIACSEDYKEIGSHLRSRLNEACPGIWSGKRSAIVQDLKTKKLYKLKGVSLDLQNPMTTRFDDGFFRIDGGQKRIDAQYEMEKSERFNRILQGEGIKPAMKYKGIWKYPLLVKGRRPVASICEIEGDTRLDELMYALEASAKNHIGDGESYYTSEGSIFFESIQRFYYNAGDVVGGLKRLMDKSGQTWSCQGKRTNAHIGNVVLWREKKLLNFGLVDFDASMTPKELSESEIKDLQRNEYNSIIESIPNFSSPRPIGTLREGGVYFPGWRKEFARGFEKGYKSSRKEYCNVLPLNQLDEIFTLLRSRGSFTKSESNIKSEFNGLEQILDTFQTLGDSSYNIIVKISRAK